ncbi:MAG: hypothetical protein ACFFD2_05375 [Promethearchaeota archaeon]
MKKFFHKNQKFISIRELNSKQHHSVNKDIWWYHISSPSNLNLNDIIVLNLYDTEHIHLLKKFEISLNEIWLNRILRASTHFQDDIEICKIHIQKNHGENKYLIYFGRKEDGVYYL